MLTITICVGSSCHVRGSDEVAETFDKLIQKENLADKVEMVGAFCMDACSMGVSVRVGDKIFRGIRPEDAETFFYKEIKSLVAAN
ncbi:MAG: (2Fe-2S) ferredoxin domain-containing protein [Chloroflexi bacterium]|nr:(2Fe-2S) ferredoxin domain-containing protein [Chloroflexota bacterium]